MRCEAVAHDPGTWGSLRCCKHAARHDTGPLPLSQDTLLGSVTAPLSPPVTSGTQQAASASNQRVAAVTLQTSPYCGNGKCDKGETCSTCPQDCKQVTSAIHFRLDAVEVLKHASNGQPAFQPGCTFLQLNALLPHSLLQADGKTPCKRIGMMYSVWHWPASRAMDIQKAAGRTPITVEVCVTPESLQLPQLWLQQPVLPLLHLQPANRASVCLMSSVPPSCISDQAGTCCGHDRRHPWAICPRPHN